MRSILACGLVLGAPVLGQGGVPTFVPTSYPVGDAPAETAIGDVNGDAGADLVVACSGSSELAVLLGGGDGTFGAATLQPAGNGPRAPVLADLDGNALLDVVIFSSGSQSLDVLLGNGSGAFAPASSYAIGGASAIFRAGDLDIDGNVDLVYARTNADDVVLRLGNGDGTFAAPQVFTSPPVAIISGDVRDIELGDVDASGLPDVAVGRDALRVEFLIDPGSAAAHFGTPWIPSFTGVVPSLALGDVNGDSRLDAQLQNDDCCFADPGILETILGNGDGTFCCQKFIFPSDFKNTPELLDLNGDGKLDHASRHDGALHLRLGAGDGTFPTIVPSPTFPAAVFGTVGADLDQDGFLDLVVNMFSLDAVSVLVNQLCPVASVEDVTPATVEALALRPAIVRLSGCHLHQATGVFVDAKPLPPGAFSSPGPGLLVFAMPMVDHLGAVEVRVSTPMGTATAQLTVVVPAQPLIVLASEGSQHLLHTALGTNLKTGASPGDAVFLLASPDPSPSALPGILAADIGMGLSSLSLVSISVVPAKAWLQQDFTLAGLAPGTTLYVQAGVLEAPQYALPLTMTNVDFGTVVN